MRLLLFIPLLLLVSCKKELLDENLMVPTISPCDTTYIDNFSDDTIQPSPFLMMYPGSWWTYSDGTSYNSSAWVPVMITTQTQANGNCITIYRDRKIVPTSSYYTYVYNQSSLNNHPFYVTQAFVHVVDTVVGSAHSSVSHTADWAYQYYYDIDVLERLNSLVVDGITYFDVVHTLETRYWYISANGNGPSAEYHHFFAKNVGRIRTVDNNYGNTDTINLSSFYIAPH